MTSIYDHVIMTSMKSFFFSIFRLMATEIWFLPKKSTIWRLNDVKLRNVSIKLYLDVDVYYNFCGRITSGFRVIEGAPAKHPVTGNKNPSFLKKA